MHRHLPAFGTTLWLMLAVAAQARAADECPPAFKTLRYDEDYACLREHDAPRSALDAIKDLPLAFDIRASVGGEARIRYDYQHNPAWGQDPQDEHGALLQRYLIHADVRDDDARARAFVQLRSALEHGREADPSPVEDGALELQQAFADIEIVRHDSTHLTTRLGRQELRFGSERLVSVREGPNVRRRFDGLRNRSRTPGWQLDAVAL